MTSETKKKDASVRNAAARSKAPYSQSEEILRLQNALRESEERYRLVMDTATDAIVILDQEGDILYINGAAEKTFGYLSGELIGCNITTIIHDRSKEDCVRMLSQNVETGECREKKAMGIQGVHKDGKTVALEVSCGVTVRNGRKFYTGILRDVSEANSLKDQLLQAQKMEAVGRLAGGVAHDFNNILTTIRGNSGFIMESLTPGTQAMDYAEEISRAADKAASLVRQLLAFSRRQSLKPRVFKMTDLVLNMERMARRLIGEHIQLELKMTQDPCSVMADPVQIEQVLLNMIVNARDAMPEKGNLTIRVENMTVEEPIPAVHEHIRPGRYCGLFVQDNGTGIPSEILPHIFEPFFTTKGKEEGSGLGLAMAYGIVKKHDGYITVESQPGQGSLFTIYLPASMTEVASPAVPDKDGRMVNGHGTVLVVEDDSALHSFIYKALCRLGYSTFLATTPKEAMDIIKDLGKDRVDVLLTDMIMPEMSGRNLADMLRVENQKMKVLYTSGYPDYELKRHGILTEGLDFIRKPYTIELLSQKLQEILSR